MKYIYKVLLLLFKGSGGSTPANALTDQNNAVLTDENGEIITANA